MPEPYRRRVEQTNLIETDPDKLTPEHWITSQSLRLRRLSRMARRLWRKRGWRSR
jgi:hypothetical protein